VQLVVLDSGINGERIMAILSNIFREESIIEEVILSLDKRLNFSFFNLRK